MYLDWEQSAREDSVYLNGFVWTHNRYLHISFARLVLITLFVGHTCFGLREMKRNVYWAAQKLHAQMLKWSTWPFHFGCFIVSLWWRRHANEYTVERLCWRCLTLEMACTRWKYHGICIVIWSKTCGECLLPSILRMIIRWRECIQDESRHLIDDLSQNLRVFTAKSMCACTKSGNDVSRWFMTFEYWSELTRFDEVWETVMIAASSTLINGTSESSYKCSAHNSLTVVIYSNWWLDLQCLDGELAYAMPAS